MKTICRSFRQDFPEFVERAEALGVGIGLGEGRRKGKHDRVFWLDGYRQLSGYTTRQDGQPFTRDDAARHSRRHAPASWPRGASASWGLDRFMPADVSADGVHVRTDRTTNHGRTTGRRA